MSDPRDHHYAPQFFLRNFASDEERTKVHTVGKNGDFAVWAERSIQGIGFERDYYVHVVAGVPVSVETEINARAENPISKSDTWAKISSGDTAALDGTDKAILYALIRHLEVRSPHFLTTQMELAEMAADPKSHIPFTDEERRRYGMLRQQPTLAKAWFNQMAATLNWSEASYKGSGLSIMRSPIPLRTSTVPVISVRAPPDPALSLPLPGMMPYSLVLTLNPKTIAVLVLGEFEGGFANIPIEETVARGFNRQFIGHFAHFDHVRHLVTGRDGLLDEMTWARFDLLRDTPRKIVFERSRASFGSSS